MEQLVAVLSWTFLPLQRTENTVQGMKKFVGNLQDQEAIYLERRSVITPEMKVIVKINGISKNKWKFL